MTPEVAEAQRLHDRALGYAALDEAILRKTDDDLAAFVVRAWELVEPGVPLIWNWHIDEICNALRKVPSETLDLVICIPPGCMKSLLVSVFWPAWLWLHRPNERLICFANDGDLASRDSRKMRTIVKSPWYKGLVEEMHARYCTPLWGIAKDQDSKVNFETTDASNRMLGARACLSLGAKVTGKRCDGMIIDDPLDAKEVITGSPSQVRRRLTEINNTIEKVLPTRLNNPKTSWRVMIMQRLHVDDPAQRAIAAGATNLVFPMRYDPDHPQASPVDPRQPNELLIPERFDDAFDEMMRSQNKLGARHYHAQYAQRPDQDAGGLFKRRWFQRRFAFDPMRAKWDRVEISVDASFKNTDGTDYNVLQAWGVKDGDFYLLDQVRDRMDYPELKAALRDFSNKWRRARAVVIEEKANGAALIADLRKDPKRVSKPTVIAFVPTASKLARAELAADYWSAGRCILPESAPWVDDFIDELLSFPGGSHDDQVDGMSQMMLRLTEREAPGGSVEEALRKRLGYMGV